MIKPKIEKAINEQINAEMFSAYLYLSMAAYLDSVALKGAALWMEIQVQEEMGHAVKLLRFIEERGGRVELLPIEKPKKDWNSLLEIFEDAYKHEVMITGRINDLVSLASEEKDYATFNMLQWFVEEQVEEEASVDEIVQKLKLVGDSKEGLFMIDQELGQRPPAVPIATLGAPAGA